MTIIKNALYAAEEIAENYDDAFWWRHRFYHRAIGPVTKVFAEDGIDIMAEDWDNLLVLDACRADTFESVIGVDRFDNYERKVSRASATPEWMQINFADRSFGDTVYVSGNPWVSKIAPDGFHDIKNIWLDDYDIDQTQLDDAATLKEIGISFKETVGAKRVNKAALETAAEYPNKRTIVHYLQPHAPYVGNRDGSIKKDVPACHPGDHLRRGEVSKETMLELYEENLAYVWHHAKELAAELDGKTVITSDHGEMFGERIFRGLPFRGYDHPIGLHASELVTVPWAVWNGDRREITSEGTSKVTVDVDVADERLRDLGYKM
jgi:hypothetical protein